VVTICTAQWSLYVPHSGHYMYRQFNIQQFYVLPTQYLCFLWDLKCFLCKWVDQTTFLCLDSNPNAIALAGPTCLALETIVENLWSDGRRQRTGLQEVTQWPAESRCWDVFTVVWAVVTCLEGLWEETETSRRSCHVNPSNRCPKIVVLIAASGRQSPHSCALLMFREEDKRRANSCWSCSIDGHEVNTPTCKQSGGLRLGREKQSRTEQQLAVWGLKSI